MIIAVIIGIILVATGVVGVRRSGRLSTGELVATFIGVVLLAYLATGIIARK